MLASLVSIYNFTSTVFELSYLFIENRPILLRRGTEKITKKIIMKPYCGLTLNFSGFLFPENLNCQFDYAIAVCPPLLSCIK